MNLALGIIVLSVDIALAVGLKHMLENFDSIRFTQ